MTEEGFLTLQSEVLQMLTADLDSRLKYHNHQHTEDVVLNAQRIAIAENISDQRLLMLIRIAALFHDTGFIDKYAGHEERSCEIMANTLDQNQLTSEEISLVKGMIMATKMPQSPKTIQESIICDADLDYLGREDFPVINSRLKEEWLSVGKLDDEKDWNQIQIKFLENHKYFTNSSLKDRNPGKLKQLALLKMKVNAIKP